MSRLDLYLDRPGTAIVTGACPHDCPDTCSWQVAVDTTTGRAIDLWGHPDHPVTQGRLCGKVDRYLERTYHPDRLQMPLRRTGPKGSGQFHPISWDEAIAEVADNLRRVVNNYGAESVLPYSYCGTMGLLQGEGMARRFLYRLGASRLAQTICAEAGFEGYGYTTGKVIGMEAADFAHARLILLWGTNTLTSNQHLWPFVQEARKSGARVIVIDPARTRTARAADEWIPIHPGTDGALALALMHVIIGENLYDEAYVAAYTAGFAQLAERVRQYPPEWAASVTGVDAERIRQFAREYATTRPAAIRINYGLQRHAGGGMAVRSLVCLPALVGAWRERGGGILLSASGSYALDRRGLYRPDLLGERQPRTINMNRLGDALSLDSARLARAHYHPRPVDAAPAPGQAGPPIKALIVYNSNPAAVAPDQGAVLEGLRREDLFTVVLEHFQTDTADYADIVLPATTQLEHWDLLKPYGHLFLALNRPAIAAIGESLPNSEIFRRLALALDFDEPCFHQNDVQILQEFVAKQTDPMFASTTWERLLQEGFARLDVPEPYVPFAEGNYLTPSGKCEFFSERLAADGYDPLPTWTPPQHLQPAPPESPAAALTCISPPAHSFLNSTFANMDRFVHREREPVVWLHPIDAAARRIDDGSAVCLANDHGSVTLTAQVTTDIAPGVVLAPSVWWSKLSPDRRNINQLTPQDEADMGGGALFYDVKAWVTRID